MFIVYYSLKIKYIYFKIIFIENNFAIYKTYTPRVCGEVIIIITLKIPGYRD